MAEGAAWPSPQFFKSPVSVWTIQDSNGGRSMFTLAKRNQTVKADRLSNGGIKKRIFKYRTLYLMVLPAFISYFLLKYVPLWGFSLAFFDYKVGKPLLECDFVGFKHFIKFFSDISNAGNIFLNTIIINVAGIVFTYLVGVILAIFMYENRAKKLTRTSQLFTLFPYFLSSVIVYSLASVFFSQNNGVINTILLQLDIVDAGINFLGSDITRWVMVFSRVWCQAGYYAILLYSTLTSINTDEFDAAAIDGASRWQRIRYISLPHLKGTVSVLLVVSVGSILGSSLDQFMLWTNSQNYDSMITFSMYIYNYGLGKMQFSYAAAVDLFNGVVSTILVLAANKVSKKVSESSLV